MRAAALMLRAMRRIVYAVLCMLAAASATAGPGAFVSRPEGPPLAPRRHGFMLYLSQPLGGGGGGALHPKFGLRIEQVRMMGNSGAPGAGDPIQHRALIGWQLEGLSNLHASDMKLELGSRVTYDVTRRAFKPSALHDSETRSPSLRAAFRSASETLPPLAPSSRAVPPPKSKISVRPSLPQGEM
jgi:hypothetical protein